MKQDKPKKKRKPDKTPENKAIDPAPENKGKTLAKIFKDEEKRRR